MQKRTRARPLLFPSHFTAGESKHSVERVWAPSGYADYPGMIGKGCADLRDLPLLGTWIGIILKLSCDCFGSRRRSLPTI